VLTLSSISTLGDASSGGLTSISNVGIPLVNRSDNITLAKRALAEGLALWPDIIKEKSQERRTFFLTFASKALAAAGDRSKARQLVKEAMEAAKKLHHSERDDFMDFLPVLERRISGKPVKKVPFGEADAKLFELDLEGALTAAQGTRDRVLGLMELMSVALAALEMGREDFSARILNIAHPLLPRLLKKYNENSESTLYTKVSWITILFAAGQIEEARKALASQTWLEDNERRDIGRGAALIGQIPLAEKMAQEIQEPSIAGRIYSAVGVYYLRKKEVQTAKEYFDRAVAAALQSDQYYKSAEALSKIASDTYPLDPERSADIFDIAIRKADRACALVVRIAMNMARLGKGEKAFEIISDVDDPTPQSAGYFDLAEYLFKKSRSGYIDGF
jgi:tetratricopeptide (TPR) repeat protein